METVRAPLRTRDQRLVGKVPQLRSVNSFSTLFLRLSKDDRYV